MSIIIILFYKYIHKLVFIYFIAINNFNAFLYTINYIFNAIYIQEDIYAC